jgi:hypothetical protein
MTIHKIPRPRILLPLVHTTIAVALLLHLYGPGWNRHRQNERRYQAQIEAEARAGTWKEYPKWVLDPDDGGPPNEISILMLPDFPSLLLGGWGVIPGPALLEQAPGRLLPSTREILWAFPFLICVWLQWFLVGRRTETKELRLWQVLLWWVPFLFVALELVYWSATGRLTADPTRLVEVLFWPSVFLILVIRRLYRRLSSMSRTPVQKA